MEIEVQAGVAETPEQAIARRDAAIKQWLDDRALLNSIKPREVESRKTVTEILFPSAHKGTQRFALNNGYAIKLVHGYTYTLGNRDLVRGEGELAAKVPIAEQVNEAIAKIQAISADYDVDTLIKWKPELSETEYRKLDVGDPIKEIIDSILTIKPATPQLTFEEPKAK